MFRIALFEAIRTLRANFFHTLLSTLGIIIGVGALVAILSLGDGMEQFGREQISSTTDLSAVVVQTITNEEVDGLYMKKEHIRPFTEDDAQVLDSIFKDKARIQLETGQRNYLALVGDTLRKPAEIKGVRQIYFPDTTKMVAGSLFSKQNFQQRDSLILLSENLAKRFSHDTTQIGALVGQTLQLEQTRFRIAGILKQTNPMDNTPIAYLPLYGFSADALTQAPPTLVLEAQKAEETQMVKKDMENWLDKNVAGGKKNYQIITNDFRLDQFKKAIMVFKIIMGMITGIAVLVGGIGVMNVLLMSITERTREIGIRKALGAKRRSIALQFLSEALVISMLGCFLGLLLGTGFMAIAVPLVRHFAEVPFHASLSWSSGLVVLIVAVLIGVIFGTYPAIKASKLTPVEAIRRE
ncbi:MAG: ABC transporter permease [Lewinellaceae bacterium]|nr:ABC transporter permease [Lewinellaceae bacterium]